MLAGVSTRKYRRCQEPVGDEVEYPARPTSKSSVSRAFVQRTREALWHLMSRQLADLRLAVVMLDGIEIKGRANVVALGITTAGEQGQGLLFVRIKLTRPHPTACSRH
jgi:hypothetical protein